MKLQIFGNTHLEVGRKPEIRIAEEKHRPRVSLKAPQRRVLTYFVSQSHTQTQLPKVVIY